MIAIEKLLINWIQAYVQPPAMKASTAVHQAKNPSVAAAKLVSRLGTHQKENLPPHDAATTPVAESSVSQPAEVSSTRSFGTVISDDNVDSIPRSVSTLLPQMFETDHTDNLLDILYNFRSEELHVQFVTAINTLLGLPERPFAPCYPGESPTLDNKCPVCDVVVSGYVHSSLCQFWFTDAIFFINKGSK
jgi:hypothetical protein